MSEVKTEGFDGVAVCNGEGECWKQCGCTCDRDLESNEPAVCKGECPHAKCAHPGDETTGFYCRPLPCMYTCNIYHCVVCSDPMPERMLGRGDRCSSCFADEQSRNEGGATSTCVDFAKPDAADCAFQQVYLDCDEEPDNVRGYPGAHVMSLNADGRCALCLADQKHSTSLTPTTPLAPEATTCEFCGSQVATLGYADHTRNHYIDAGTSIISHGDSGFQLPAPDYSKWPLKGQLLMLHRYMRPHGATQQFRFRSAVDGYNRAVAKFEDGSLDLAEIRRSISQIDAVCPPETRFMGLTDVMIGYDRLTSSIIGE